MLIQLYIMLSLIFIYMVLGAIPVIIIMAIVTFITKDKAYFRKKLGKLSR